MRNLDAAFSFVDMPYGGKLALGHRRCYTTARHRPHICITTSTCFSDTLLVQLLSPLLKVLLALRLGHVLRDNRALSSR